MEIINQKGTKPFPSSFITMDVKTQIQQIETLLQDIIANEPSVFVVEVWIKPTNNVRVYLDADQGISIDKLVRYNRSLYKQIEESGMYPAGEFSLELSSPGLDEPLKLNRQYHKNIGRFVEVTLNDGTKKEGKLSAVTEEEITIEEEKGKNKKKEIVTHTIPFSTIKSTKIQIKF